MTRVLFGERDVHLRKGQTITVFHLAISNIALRHIAFCERHVALREHHVAIYVRHVAFLIFRQWNAFLNLIVTSYSTQPGHCDSGKDPQSLILRAHTYDAIPDNGLCTW